MRGSAACRILVTSTVVRIGTGHTPVHQGPTYAPAFSAIAMKSERMLSKSRCVERYGQFGVAWFELEMIN
jgi:hypothetical protein